ncbi:MAG: carboxypeptidase-like regulatory domain-containing protein, partial [Candidatus Bipolaricaulota bacterium]|nr:carboxypeptidase-like regulatory domain-containing protein [Candidatus Bipolaricaulota bacterium]
MLKRLLFVGLALSALALSGCLFVRAPQTGVIEGYVTNHLSGEPVAGATVRAWPMDGEAPRYGVISDYYGPMSVTDANGFYRLTVPEGMYVVEARKEGHATSRVVGVKVASTARVDLVQKPVANPKWSLEPPKVTVTGVTEGMTISGPISVKIDAQGPNDIQLIYAAFGKVPGAGFLTSPRAVFSQTYTTGTFTIDPATYGVSGWTTFDVVVYDMNDNRVHVIYRVYVTPGAAGPASPPSAPTANILVDGTLVLIPARTALAVTLSRQTAYFGVEPQAAPAGGNLYVELRWLKAAQDAAGVSGDGYRIYRRLAGEADYRLLYTVDATGAASYLYRDSTPDLRVGVRADYRITYFRGTAESAPLEASCTPLPAWDVRLLAPADGARDVPLYPTFTWEPTALVGATRFYRIRIWDTPHGGFTITIPPPLDATSVTYPGIPGGPFERLQPHRMYQWEVQAALAIDTVANAVSIAANNGYTGVFPTLVHPDVRAFTTQDW